MEEQGNKVVEAAKKRPRKPLDPIASLEGGKLTPQAPELEEAVLGALMLDREAVNETIDILKPTSFYKDANQRIFDCILSLFQRSEPIDILTVTNELRARGELDLVGGPYYISQLTNRVASAANIEFHARIIAQKHILRELIRISSETIKNAYDETTDVFSLLDQTEKDLFSIAEGNIRKNYDKMSSLLQEAIEQIQQAKNNDDGVSGVPSGFTDLDRLTSGWQKSDLIILAARPGMGKTAFILSMARNIALDFKRAVGIFSLEMSSLQLVNRLIASETEISAEKLRKGSLAEHEYQQLHARIGKLADAPIFIDDTPGLSIFELRAKARRLVAQHKVEIILIDYLQLMTAGGDNKGNREQEISTISRSIKGLAKELNVPIIALSQLSRAVETRGGDKRPMLSDLRESGAIEQDADLVSFIYRPEYYGLTEDENGESTIGTGEVIVAKHRNGALENVKLRFVPNLAKFTNLETYDFGDSDAIQPYTAFSDEAPTIIRGSRMDDIEDDSLGNSEPPSDVPF